VDSADELVDAFLTASRVLVGVAVRSIDSAEPAVTTPQHRLLVLLAGRGPQLIGTLATELNVNSSSATRQCDRLEKKGLVARSRSEADGRAVEVALTPRGRALLDRVTRVRRAEIAAIVGRMDTTDAAHAVACLARFSAAAGEVPDADWVAEPGYTGRNQS
jgi:DNA-binding MarR family transcriptional regulator